MDNCYNISQFLSKLTNTRKIKKQDYSTYLCYNPVFLINIIIFLRGLFNLTTMAASFAAISTTTVTTCLFFYVRIQDIYCQSHNNKYNNKFHCDITSLYFIIYNLIMILPTLNIIKETTQASIK